MPDFFVGGQVLFTGTKIRRNVATADFASMYPSLIRDGGVSPECIDFIDYESRDKSRFDHIHALCTYRYHPNLNTACI